MITTQHIYTFYLIPLLTEIWGKNDRRDLQACIQFVNKYEADRGGRAAPTRGDPSRITRGDLTLPMVPIFREILSTLATPTMSNARSVYQVALWLYRKRTEGGEPEAA